MMMVTESGCKPICQQENGLYVIGDQIHCRSSLVSAYNRLWNKHPLTVCEVGVQRGDNAEIILRVLEPERLLLIDVWKEIIDPTGVESYLNAHIDYPFVKARFADCPCVELWKESSVGALRALPDNYLDYLYIDGDHSTPVCREDILSGLRVVKECGVLGGHDYGYSTCKAHYLPGMGGVDAAVHGVFEGMKVNGEMGDWWIEVSEEYKTRGAILRTQRGGKRR